MFEVLRHGGNSNHKWESVLETGNFEEAEMKYNEIHEGMRQGGVRLINNVVGSVLKSAYAPRLRTKW